ncbi:MAG: YjfB family protein [Clostridiales bacterium]|jgi:hypothetical protein|nr:YjfB family protein [Clostridiales bacterium]
MDFYGIAAASVSMNTAKLMQEVNVALLNKSMKQQADSVGQLLESIAPASASGAVPASPASAHKVDVLI